MSDNYLKKICNSGLVRTFGPALLGFLAYGGWAFFCNISHGLKMGIQSGLVQGTLSFAITLVFNSLMELLFRKTNHKWPTIAITCVLFIGTSYWVNVWVGTPEVLWTIAPGAIFGSIYVFTYVTALARLAAPAKSEI